MNKSTKKLPLLPEGAEVTPDERARFCRIAREVIAKRHVQGTDGIGTMAEKRMHVILKRYLSSDPATHEIPLAGSRYVSDVRVGDEIIEIQTGDLAPMREKLAYYLKNTDCKITVVHPLSVDKWIARVDKETKSISERVKSPKHEYERDLLAALFPLRSLLVEERICFRLLFLETLEFRLKEKTKSGRYKRERRYECVPVSLLGARDYRTREDFKAFLPTNLPETFTVREFSDATEIRGIDAYSAVRVLVAIGILTECGHRGRAMLFSRAEN